MAITPFDYQTEARDALFDYWVEKPGRFPLLVMATGAGKTILFAIIAQEVFRRYGPVSILFLAHRGELISQTEDKLTSVWPEAPVGVYSAKLKRREIAPITIASRDTIAPALGKIPNYRPALIFVDEAHNISQKEETRYRKLINELQARNTNMNVTGLTATPFRTNHGVIYGPDEFFDDVVYQIDMRTLIDRGRLAPLVSKAVRVDAKIDTSRVDITGGEFNNRQLAEASLNLQMIDAAIDDWIQKAVHTGRKSTLFFCVSVAHAEAVQTALAMRGYDFPLVTGTTADSERGRVCGAFEAGRIGGLINVGVFTEGTDFPIIDCIVNLRPVNSLGLWIQMAGRGMRIHPDPAVADCLLLDYGGCIERFGPIDMAQPPAKRGKKQEHRTKECPECETHCGWFQRRCHTCNFEFQAPPHKLCEQCGAENAPSADRCSACGHLFARHGTTASDADVMSTPNRFRLVPITGAVYCIGMVSQQNGNPYLQVIFPSDPNRNYIKNLFIGYDGLAGKKSLVEWRRLVKPGTPDPANVEHACRLADSGDIFRPVASVTVDTSSQYKDVVSISFNEQQQEQAA